MFFPTVPCTITRVGNFNQYGEEATEGTFRERCGVVRLRRDRAHSTVRSDSSATRGHADEDRADVIILLTANTNARIGDKLQIDKFMTIRIQNLHPRYNIPGRLDHYEVKGEIWE